MLYFPALLRGKNLKTAARLHAVFFGSDANAIGQLMDKYFAIANMSCLGALDDTVNSLW